MNKPEVTKQIDFIRQETGADVSTIGIDELGKLCRYCLKVIASDGNPRVAAMVAKEIGITI